MGKGLTGTRINEVGILPTFVRFQCRNVQSLLAPTCVQSLLHHRYLFIKCHDDGIALRRAGCEGVGWSEEGLAGMVRRTCTYASILSAFYCEPLEACVGRYVTQIRRQAWAEALS